MFNYPYLKNKGWSWQQGQLTLIFKEEELFNDNQVPLDQSTIWGCWSQNKLELVPPSPPTKKRVWRLSRRAHDGRQLRVRGSVAPLWHWWMIRQGDVPLAPGFPPSANTHEGGSFCIETGRGCRSCLRGPLQLPSCTAELVCLFWQPLHHTCEWRGRYAKWRGAGFLSETAKSTRVKHSHLCSTLRGTPHPLL